ncbi:zinc ribbon-containing protein [Paenibacillus sp. FSL K6-3166]|uniref:zinc ribbon-containing protein n=1 Tax=unclassified Paenibacillus TaxID=185978 RepID=UPI00211AB95A|nr:zinc ribbon-containing protein [Paenibacillus sp. VTT E-133291]
MSVENIKTREVIKLSTTGEKPGVGTYTCTKCGTKVTLDDNTDTLPPCPKCHNTEYTP